MKSSTVIAWQKAQITNLHAFQKCSKGWITHLYYLCELLTTEILFFQCSHKLFYFTFSSTLCYCIRDHRGSNIPKPSTVNAHALPSCFSFCRIFPLPYCNNHTSCQWLPILLFKFLIGPSGDNPVEDTLAVLHINNRL